MNYPSCRICCNNDGVLLFNLCNCGEDNRYIHLYCKKGSVCRICKTKFRNINNDDTNYKINLNIYIKFILLIINDAIELVNHIKKFSQIPLEIYIMLYIMSY